MAKTMKTPFHNRITDCALQCKVQQRGDKKAHEVQCRRVGLQARCCSQSTINCSHPSYVAVVATCSKLYCRINCSHQSCQFVALKQQCGLCCVFAAEMHRAALSGFCAVFLEVDVAVCSLILLVPSALANWPMQ